LSEEEQREVDKLEHRDQEVRAHEQAHLAAAGPYSRGGPRYEYERGPDNHRYAVGGEVSIDTSPVKGDPEATIEKARIVKRAALAPSEPSSQDRQVAAEAANMEAEARREIAKRDREEGGESGGAGSTAVRETAQTTAQDGDAARGSVLVGGGGFSDGDQVDRGQLDLLA
jgi:hypothetical protein